VSSTPKKLSELPQGASGVIEALHLPEHVAECLLGFGVAPGTEVTAAHAAPGGDPRVYHVDGCHVALRRETAQHIAVRVPAKPSW